MDTFIELFDLRSGNLMASFSTEQEAWEELRQMALAFGLEELNDLALSRMQNDHRTLIAMEDELVRRVEHEMSQDALPSEAHR